jgi:integrase
MPRVFAFKGDKSASSVRGSTQLNQYCHVDFAQGIVRLEAVETKNDEGRTVYLDDEVKELFKAQWEVREERRRLIPYVFTKPDGTDRVKDFSNTWSKACKDANIGTRLFHDFRRTAVRNMVRAGVAERVAMVVSGHKTRSVFARYNIVSPEDLKLAAMKQEIYLQAQVGTNSGTITVLEIKKEARQ